MDTASARFRLASNGIGDDAVAGLGAGGAMATGNDDQILSPIRPQVGRRCRLAIGVVELSARSKPYTFSRSRRDRVRSFLFCVP